MGQPHTKSFSLKQVLITTALFVTVGQLALTIYLPSMPIMAKDLHVSSSAMQSTVILFLLPFGISQLFYGFLSDRYGRKITLMVGQGIVLLGSLFLVFSFHWFTGILIARFIQGLGAGSGAVLARAIIRDCYDEKNLAAALSILIMSVSLTPAVAPFFGGWIQHVFGWHMIFIVFLVYAFLITLLIWLFLPETLSKDAVQTAKQSNILRSFKTLLTHEYYLICVLMVIFIYSTQVIYLIVCPFIFEQQWHMSPQLYGTVIIIPALGYLLGNYLTKRYSFHYTPQRLITAGIAVMFVASVLMLVMALLNSQSEAWLLTFLTVLTIGLGLAFPSTTSLSLRPFAALAGAAAALSGFLQMLGTSIVSSIINAFKAETLLVLAISLMTCIFILALLFKVLSSRLKLKS